MPMPAGDNGRVERLRRGEERAAQRQREAGVTRCKARRAAEGQFRTHEQREQQRSGEDGGIQHVVERRGRKARPSDQPAGIEERHAHGVQAREAYNGDKVASVGTELPCAMLLVGVPHIPSVVTPEAASHHYNAPATGFARQRACGISENFREESQISIFSFGLVMFGHFVLLALMDRVVSSAKSLRHSRKDDMLDLVKTASFAIMQAQSLKGRV